MTATEIEKAAATEGSTSPNTKTGSPDSKNAAIKTASPSKEATPADRKKEALEYFVAGKRHLLVKDLDAAVTSLALASELLSAEHGEAAYECADAYYYYGKALLEMARAEAGVFGNALDGVPDGEDSDNSQVEDPEKMTEEERDDVEKKVGEALDENFDVLEEKRLKKADSTEDETEDDEESKEDEQEVAAEPAKDAAKEAEPAKAASPAKEAEAEKEKSEPKEDIADKGTEEEDKKAQEVEDEEDPSNLQLAWEMLELAKVAYTTKLTSATEDEKKVVDVKVCETLLLLGEVSLESENYEQAVTDINDCLAKRKVLHAEDSRRIAETHYHLGVALGHFNKFDEAITSLESSIAVLKQRVENLKAKTESKDESKADDAFYTREAEITEIESLIPEIQEKIQDTKDMKEQEKDPKEESGFSGAGKSDAKPISSISVKRKADGDNASPTKKAHVENGN